MKNGASEGAASLSFQKCVQWVLNQCRALCKAWHKPLDQRTSAFFSRLRTVYCLEPCLSSVNPAPHFSNPAQLQRQLPKNPPQSRQLAQIVALRAHCTGGAPYGHPENNERPRAAQQRASQPPIADRRTAPQRDGKPHGVLPVLSASQDR